MITDFACTLQDFEEIQIRIDNQSGMVALMNNKALKKHIIKVIPGELKSSHQKEKLHDRYWHKQRWLLITRFGTLDT